MEINSAIISRKVVGLEDCCTLGEITGIVVDCKTKAVSHFTINGQGKLGKCVLPFEKTLNIGKTFVVIQSSSDLVEGKFARESKLFDTYELVDLPVYSKAGDECGKILSYEYDPVFGDVTTLFCEEDKQFTREQFEFFAQEFVFIDDGTVLNAELRSQGKPESEKPAGEEEAAPEDEHLASYLVGAVLGDNFESPDGSLKLEKGTTLDENMVAKARDLGMLISLTMAVE